MAETLSLRARLNDVGGSRGGGCLSRGAWNGMEIESLRDTSDVGKMNGWTGLASNYHKVCCLLGVSQAGWRADD